jgi:DMSO reductase anchor subunit
VKVPSRLLRNRSESWLSNAAIAASLTVTVWGSGRAIAVAEDAKRRAEMTFEKNIVAVKDEILDRKDLDCLEDI